VGLYLASTLPSIRPPQHSNSEKRFSTIRLGKGWARGGNGPIERERNGDPLVALASAGNGTWGTNGVSPSPEPEAKAMPQSERAILHVRVCDDGKLRTRHLCLVQPSNSSPIHSGPWAIHSILSAPVRCVACSSRFRSPSLALWLLKPFLSLLPVQTISGDSKIESLLCAEARWPLCAVRDAASGYLFFTLFAGLLCPAFPAIVRGRQSNQPGCGTYQSQETLCKATRYGTEFSSLF